MIAICIATYRRPFGLQRLLRSLEAQLCDHQVRVIVADNDIDNFDGLRVVEEIGSTYKWQIVGVPSRQRGISSTRNVAIQSAFANFTDLEAIATIDDDMTASPRWLQELVKALREFEADIAGGPVYPIFEVPPPSWIVEGGFFAPEDLPRGLTPIARSTNNLLVRAGTFARYMPEPFDIQFGLSGGEDYDFALRCKMAGHLSVWADTAIAHEYVPESRMAKDWLAARARRIGNSNVRAQSLHQPGMLEQTKRLGKTAGLYALGALALLRAGSNEVRRLKAMLMIERAGGKIQAHFDRAPILSYHINDGK